MNYKQYEVWHDECKTNGFHHGILFIPLDKKDLLISYLKQIRDEFNIPYNRDCKFSHCLGKEKTSRLISNHLLLLSHIMKSKVNSPTYLRNITGKSLYKQEYPHYIKLVDLFGCKYGFLSNYNYLQSFKCDSYSRKIELTFRFILKCCCHALFDFRNPIEIIKFYFDGFKHIGTDFDLNYLSSIRLRDYCKISPSISIDSRHIKDRDDVSKMIMNLTDNAVSAFSSILNNASDPYNVLLPLLEIFSRVKKNLIFKNKYSEWYRSISFSEVEVVNDQIKFPEIFRNKDQLKLEFY